jgi:hypothetical protein
MNADPIEEVCSTLEEFFKNVKGFFGFEKACIRGCD